jgi:CheY-like chemotaxis protein
MLRILMADDAELTLALDDSFVRRAECDVLTATSGVEALRKARETRPSLLLLDVAMPECSGLDVCKAVKSDPDLASLPVVLFGDESALPRMLEAGADGTVFRPLSGPRLVEAMHGLVDVPRRSSPRRAASLRVDFYWADDREGCCYTKDIGTTGLFLKTREPPAAESGLQVIFDLPLEDRPTIRADGHVVRVVPAEPDSYLIPGFGVRFRQISARDRSALTRFVDG